ncbi:MAG: 2-C-methyl-D-erythritol 4-phosphate cytidylyltransferase [Halothiobacillaceae bacterium]|nr:2-C-methyl-D-erythritol 4-phosphate cytidylyltransferase [Halothiobacillaceae bacterium]
MQPVWVVIPAAGVGARMTADRPKQYLPLASRSVLEHSLSHFSQHASVRGIVLSVAIEDAYWPQLELSSSVPLHCVAGGSERAHSVLNALQFLDALMQAEPPESQDSWVLVHDAARPCVRVEDIDKLLHALHADPVGGLLAVPVRDTMKRANASGCVAHSEPRAGLWHALTPQMFRLGGLKRSLEDALAQGQQVTDESSALEWAGFSPRLVEGHADNIKITRPEDLALAEFFLQQRGVTT